MSNTVNKHAGKQVNKNKILTMETKNWMDKGKKM